MTSPKDELLALRNAIENASTIPVDDAAIICMLQGRPGPGSHLRALFSDVGLAELARVGRLHGIGLPTILNAYGRAKSVAIAARPELDQALKDIWQEA